MFSTMRSLYIVFFYKYVFFLTNNIKILKVKWMNYKSVVEKQPRWELAKTKDNWETKQNLSHWIHSKLFWIHCMSFLCVHCTLSTALHLFSQDVWSRGLIAKTGKTIQPHKISTDGSGPSCWNLMLCVFCWTIFERKEGLLTLYTTSRPVKKQNRTKGLQRKNLWVCSLIACLQSVCGGGDHRGHLGQVR